MVFLRMAEDIINMDSHLHQHRKREITQALHLHMEGLFTFFINTLQTHTTSMIELVTKIVCYTLNNSNTYCNYCCLTEKESSIIQGTG